MTTRRRRSPVEPLEETRLARRYQFSFPAPPAPDTRPNPLIALLSAFQTLSRRGVGPNAFGASFAESPLTFLLDTMQDAVFIRRWDGTVVYRNRAAETLAPVSGEKSVTHFTRDGVTYERRRMRYLEGERQIVVEVISRRG